jgi:NAD(P)-dependent dehydrogenase (short-subunit alcohol dehydrogenase family)
MRVAVVTGASRGLGFALARALARRGWALVIDARGTGALERAGSELRRDTTVAAIPGDVADDDHRRALIDAAEDLGRIDALVNNAGILGPSPPPPLSRCPVDALEHVYRVNALAPLRLFQLAAPGLARTWGRVVNVTSEAAVEPFVGWGAYGSSKAALEQLSRVMAAEHPELRVYWVDPGDLNTQMEQEGFPDEDVSDRPDPDVSVPGFLRLLDDDLPSGRYRARALAD